MDKELLTVYKPVTSNRMLVAALSYEASQFISILAGKKKVEVNTIPKNRKQAVSVSRSSLQTHIISPPRLCFSSSFFIMKLLVIYLMIRQFSYPIFEFSPPADQIKKSIVNVAAKKMQVG